MHCSKFRSLSSVAAVLACVSMPLQPPTVAAGSPEDRYNDGAGLFSEDTVVPNPAEISPEPALSFLKSPGDSSLQIIENPIDRMLSWQLSGFEKGMRLLEEGKNLEAAAAFERFRERFPDVQIAYYYLGTIYAELGYEERAESVFRGAGGPLLWAGASERMEQEILAHPESLSRMKRAVEILGDDAFALVCLARAALAAGDASSAWTSYERALELDPGERDLRLWIDIRIGISGEALEGGDPHAALAILDEAEAYIGKVRNAEDGPPGIETLHLLEFRGKLQEGEGWHERAIGSYRRCLDIEADLYGKEWFYLTDLRFVDLLENAYRKLGDSRNSEYLSGFRERVEGRREKLAFWDVILSLGGVMSIVQSVGLLVCSLALFLAIPVLRRRKGFTGALEGLNRDTLSTFPEGALNPGFAVVARVYLLSTFLPFCMAFSILVALRQVLADGEIWAMFISFILWIPLLVYGMTLLLLQGRRVTGPGPVARSVRDETVQQISRAIVLLLKFRAFAKLTSKVLYLTIVVQLFLGWWVLLDIVKRILHVAPPSL